VELHLTLLVLLAAAMHASWNTLVKRSRDRLAELSIVNFFSAIVAVIALPWVGVPDPASWVFILASIFIHTGYYYLLIQSYRFGDLSHVYPLARGVSPLAVALLSVVFVGEILNASQLAGVLLISVSVASLALHGYWRGRRELKTVALAVGTGLTIAAYTLTDGMGVRASGNPLAYIAWVFVLDCLPLIVTALVLRRGRLRPILQAQWRTGALGGVLALGAYGLVIYALSLGTMASVAALRETGVVMAAVIGSTLLGEPFGKQRILAAIGVVAGVITLRLAS
jgi:drug/metabolite transporter (DMT)-like permease